VAIIGAGGEGTRRLKAVSVVSHVVQGRLRVAATTDVLTGAPDLRIVGMSGNVLILQDTDGAGVLRTKCQRAVIELMRSLLPLVPPTTMQVTGFTRHLHTLREIVPWIAI